MDYHERLFYVARNFVLYKKYNQDVIKAAKIVTKYFKDKSIDECKADLEYAIQTYNAGIVFVESNKEEYWKRKKEQPNTTAIAERKFFSDHSRLPQGLLQYMLLEVFMWFHER